jgi:hypothetical protein
MRPNNDAPRFLQPWHLDCCFAKELPEDRVVGTRFLANALIGTCTATLVLLCAWLAWRDIDLRLEVSNFEAHQATRAPELKEIRRLQTDYMREALKIDQAHALMQVPIDLSDFIAELGRTRPERMVIDMIDSADMTTIVMRGSFQESSVRALALLKQYIETLKKNNQIGPRCSKIDSTSIRPSLADDVLNFEITFRLR